MSSTETREHVLGQTLSFIIPAVIGLIVGGLAEDPEVRNWAFILSAPVYVIGIAQIRHPLYVSNAIAFPLLASMFVPALLAFGLASTPVGLAVLGTTFAGMAAGTEIKIATQKRSR